MTDNPSGWEPDETWHAVLRQFPPTNRPIELMRHSWIGPMLLCWDALPLEMNVAGLYWREP